MATDPLSLVFLACILFSGGFLAISTVLGAQGHLAHVHLGHLGQVGHVGHVGAHSLHAAAHTGPHAGVSHEVTAHAGSSAHATQASQPSGAAGAPAIASPWQGFAQTLDSALNLYSLLMFLLAFGLVGYLLHNYTHVGTVLSLLFANALGAGSGIAMGNLLFRLFLPGAESELGADTSRLEGRLGEVSMPIREGGIGEVIFSRPGGGRQSVGARSASGTPIPVGAEVVILS